MLQKSFLFVKVGLGVTSCSYVSFTLHSTKVTQASVYHPLSLFVKAQSKLNCFLKWIHSWKENSNQMFSDIVVLLPQASRLCNCLIFIETRLGMWLFQSWELFNNALKIFSLNYFVQCTSLLPIGCFCFYFKDASLNFL